MVNLGKIELTKKGQSINLEKKAQLGPITVNLNWNQQTKSSGGFLKSLFGNNSSGIDLDLGCLFELTTGEKGAIQALGNSFGSLQHPPYIELDGDMDIWNPGLYRHWFFVLHGALFHGT